MVKILTSQKLVKTHVQTVRLSPWERLCCLFRRREKVVTVEVPDPVVRQIKTYYGPILVCHPAALSKAERIAELIERRKQ